MTSMGRVIVDEAFSIAAAPDPDVEGLVREHSRFVYRIAYSILRNPQDAEDATQDTFVRLFRYGKKLAGVRDVRSWLARTAWRVAVDRRRSVADVPLDEAAEAVFNLRAAGAGADELAASRQMTALLERLIASLPRDLREVLVLSAVDELSAPEIGAVLDIPEASVRTRLWRARQILREKLSTVLESKHG